MNEKDSDVTSVMIIDDKDWFLQTLINMVKGGGFTFGITLNVGGFLVSGNLIGGKDYFESFGTDFAEGLASEGTADKIKESFASIGYPNISDKDENKVSSPGFIHLKDAKFFNTNGNPIPENKGVLWRGRISEVSGFSLGLLSKTNP